MKDDRIANLIATLTAIAIGTALGVGMRAWGDYSIRAFSAPAEDRAKSPTPPAAEPPADVPIAP